MDDQLKLVFTTVAIAATIGFFVGHATADGNDLAYIVRADKVRDERVKSCVDDFKSALELYKNTSEHAITDIREANAKALAEIVGNNAADERIIKMALGNCDTRKEAH